MNNEFVSRTKKNAKLKTKTFYFFTFILFALFTTGIIVPVTYYYLNPVLNQTPKQKEINNKLEANPNINPVYAMLNEKDMGIKIDLNKESPTYGDVSIDETKLNTNGYTFLDLTHTSKIYFEINLSSKMYNTVVLLPSTNDETSLVIEQFEPSKEFNLEWSNVIFIPENIFKPKPIFKLNGNIKVENSVIVGSFGGVTVEENIWSFQNSSMLFTTMNQLIIAGDTTVNNCYGINLNNNWTTEWIISESKSNIKLQNTFIYKEI